MQLLLNVGGPDRVSRVEMAETVANIRGYNNSLIKSVSALSVSVPSNFELGTKHDNQASRASHFSPECKFPVVTLYHKTVTSFTSTYLFWVT